MGVLSTSSQSLTCPYQTKTQTRYASQYDLQTYIHHQKLNRPYMCEERPDPLGTTASFTKSMGAPGPIEEPRNDGWRDVRWPCFGREHMRFVLTRVASLPPQGILCGLGHGAVSASDQFSWWAGSQLERLVALVSLMMSECHEVVWYLTRRSDQMRTSSTHAIRYQPKVCAC